MCKQNNSVIPDSSNFPYTHIELCGPRRQWSHHAYIVRYTKARLKVLSLIRLVCNLASAGVCIITIHTYMPSYTHINTVITIGGAYSASPSVSSYHNQQQRYWQYIYIYIIYTTTTEIYTALVPGSDFRKLATWYCEAYLQEGASMAVTGGSFRKAQVLLVHLHPILVILMMIH